MLSAIWGRDLYAKSLQPVADHHEGESFHPHAWNSPLWLVAAEFECRADTESAGKGIEKRAAQEHGGRAVSVILAVLCRCAPRFTSQPLPR